MEESDAYIKGHFETYEEALKSAKAIVRTSMSEFYKLNMNEDELFGEYCMYGEDPAILPHKENNQEVFSARDYAETIAKKICETKGK